MLLYIRHIVLCVGSEQRRRSVRYERRVSNKSEYTLMRCDDPNFDKKNWFLESWKMETQLSRKAEIIYDQCGHCRYVKQRLWTTNADTVKQRL
jgi:hypothetical protein